MPNHEERRTVAMLRKVGLLAETPVEHLARLAGSATLGSYRPRQVVYLPGDRAAGVFFLSSGRVKVSKVTTDGKELTLAYCAAGDFFGEACLLGGGPREEMAEAREDSATIEVERGALDKVLGAHAGTAHAFARALIARRRELEINMQRVVFKDVGAKLAETLLKLGAEHGIENRRGLVLAIKITHQELANLIGSTRETVSLTLSQFKRKGFIATEGRRVILSDRQGLRAIA